MNKKAEIQNSKKQPVTSEKKNTIVTEPKDMLGILDAFFDKRLSWLIWVILGITAVFCLLLFDGKVSLSGDDSFYIIRAYDFIHSFKYPAFQGPLYPMVLSLFVAIFGISLVPLKLVSTLSILGFVYLFYIAFKARIPSSLLVITLLLISINSFILYYASQTYNEAFYILVQMVLVLVFFRFFIDTVPDLTVKKQLINHLILALSLLALVLTKSAGYSAVFAVAGYFLFRGEWKNLFYSLGAFLLVMLVFQGLKYVLWNEGGLQFSTQGSSLMNKDYYNPQAGKEDFAGFIQRLIDNSKLYLSKHLMTAIGLRKAATIMTTSIFTTIVVYLLAIGSLIITFSKNKYIFFTGLLTGAFLLVSFLILQAKWDQSRLIIPAIPTLILVLFSSLYYISKFKSYKILQFFIPVIVLIVFFQSLAVTAGAVKENRSVNGKYGGLTPDWKNYLKASEWADKNLPKDAVIACRKPSISFIYGNGRNFYGIMQVPAYSNETFFKNWEKNASEYVLFRYDELGAKPLTQDLYITLKQNMNAMLFVGDTVFLVDKVNDSARSLILENAKSIGLTPYTSVNEFKSTFNMDRQIKVYYPDSLILQLRNADVTHAMTANLRRNSTQKDGNIINTVERYLAYIQEKYPSIFVKISQVGDDNNEPAVIYKIDYDKYKIPAKESASK